MSKSEYTTQEHLNILIDNKPLDIVLHELYPDGLFLGLVPTLVDWLDSKEEVELVYSRFVSGKGQVILPILMCPDDCDFSCTVIVAEVDTKDDFVIWNRVGIDNSERKDISDTGTIVEWLEKVPAFCFDITDYKQLERIYIKGN
ncbi:hypothetical protein DNH61_03575 [Paenibacillus sambharensis]|uniref:Uncharacterized protein n=1 Tax=Paenibacillus sambharensis TaxID=1803190 RepID=A0A2W1LAF3_9BACL|nr:hypothetical protein [Paenibacillus sambharensis]PZD97228.1 hypothetical protein DNH61_03575 [Paenibacillus sambharensis]